MDKIKFLVVVVVFLLLGNHNIVELPLIPR